MADTAAGRFSGSPVHHTTTVGIELTGRTRFQSSETIPFRGFFACALGDLHHYELSFI